MIERKRLVRLLGGDNLAWLVARARLRMERGQPLDATVRLTDPTAGQRAAVQRLLGRRPRPGGTLTVRLSDVDAVLRTSGACTDGLAAAVVTLTGDVPDRTAQNAAEQRAWAQAFTPLEETIDGRPELVAWLARVRRTGLVRRLAGDAETAARLLADVAAAVRALPAEPESLATFAARVAGGAHRLDDGQPLATLTLGAARAISGVADGSGAQWRREVWASVGLLVDDVSSTVLTLGLRGDPRTASGRALAAWHETHQPAVLTLRQLIHDPPMLEERRVFVCENRAVVSAAADRLDGCAPLVCTSGQPGAAELRLLHLLAETRAELYYHGDFDWGGVRIGNVVFDRLPARPWRFTSTDYEAAARHGPELSGEPVAATWDASLSEVMRRHGFAVEEEHVIDDLLADLAE